MNDRDEVTPGELRALAREHALIVAPGEVLVIEVPPDWAPRIIRELQDALWAYCGHLEADIKVLVVPGTAVTVAPMPPDPFAGNYGLDPLASLDFALDSATARNATMNPNRATKYTALGFALNSLIDQGKTATVGEVHERIADGSLWDWLAQAGVPAVKMLPAGDRGIMLEVFQSLWNPAQPERNFYVERNGLATLVAYCFEGLQRLSAGEPPETVERTNRLSPSGT